VALMKKSLIRILTGSLLFIVALALGEFKWRLGLFILSYLVTGGDVVMRAGRNIVGGRIFDENFLMTVATVGAFFLGEYSEAVAVMLFYQIGELFQDYAVSQSRESIASLMDIRPDYANIMQGEELVQVDPEEVRVGDQIVVKPGEKIPLDAIVIEGVSLIDASALTGESVPQNVEPGSTLLSGCININGLLTAKVTKEFEESTVSKILDLVENASSKKSNSERFITRFARYYTPAVVGIAALLAFLPPLLLPAADFRQWLSRALIFLVVSCPCALVLSIPLSFFGGIGGASRKGILVKGSNYLEALAQTDTVIFDKTGTLTKGVFNVREIKPAGRTEEELLELAAYAESFSNHPISQALQKAYGREINKTRLQEVEEIAGLGVVANLEGQKIAAGNKKLMAHLGIVSPDVEQAGTIVHVAVDGVYAGYMLIADEVKPDAAAGIKALKDAGVRQLVMLTGDSRLVAEEVAKGLGIDRFYAELLPADKVAKLEEYLLNAKGKVAFVGDGINDAPVLARADIGIAMGGLGSDAAIEAADVVIMTDEPSKLVQAIGIAQKTLNIARQNTVFALGVKGIVLLLGALGMANMWAAVFADVGVAVLAILNSFRALKY